MTLRDSIQFRGMSSNIEDSKDSKIVTRDSKHPEYPKKIPKGSRIFRANIYKIPMNYLTLKVFSIFDNQRILNYA